MTSNEPECCGVCLTGSDIGIPSSEIAYAYPGCPAHDPRDDKPEFFVVKRRSQFTGRLGQMEFPKPLQESIEAFLADPTSGMHVQHQFPTLTADQREFLITGCTPEEWGEMFADMDEDEG